MKPFLPKRFVSAGLVLACLGLVTAAIAEEETTTAPAPRKLVVIDPGHGGRSDTGILLADGSAEKDLTLKLGQALQRQLQHDPALENVLTRTGDSGLSILERSNVANRKPASVFISLHIGGSHAQNLAVYVSRFLKDDQLAATAEQEIRANVRAIPWELAQNSFLPQSKKLAAALLGAWTQAHPRARESEPVGLPMAVLAGVHAPAVVVELPPDKGLWEKETGRQEAAKVLAAGISAFLAGE